MSSLPCRGQSRFSRLRQRLYKVDEKTTGLISRDKAIEGLAILPYYHNIIGVYLIATPRLLKKADLLSASARMDTLRRALAHFDRGLRFFKETGYDRKMLSLEAVLHLNTAACRVHDGPMLQARPHVSKSR